MEQSEANRLLAILEQQYFEIHHRAGQAGATLVREERRDDADIRAQLEEAEREKLAILARIAQIEDGLLDDE